MNTINGCEHYKVGKFQRSIFKEFPAEYSDASFEQCIVVLVWRFYDYKCRHGVMFMRSGAMRKNTV